MTPLRVIYVTFISLIIFESTLAVTDCSKLPVWLSGAQCKEYANYGAADVAVDRVRLPHFDEEDQENFRIVMAGLSNKYYPSITIEPRNIAIVEMFENRDGTLMLSFFVMNPTGSEYFPILFRSKELHLMMELNLDYINGNLTYKIEPQPIEDTYPLFFPIWAIVIVVYFLIVIIVFLVVMATKNWNGVSKTGSMDVDVENTDGTGGAVLLKKSYTSYGPDDFEAIEEKYRGTTDASVNNNITEVDHKADLEDRPLQNKPIQHPPMQTPPAVATQVVAADIDHKNSTATERDLDSTSVANQSDKPGASTHQGEVNEGFEMDDAMTPL